MAFSLPLYATPRDLRAERQATLNDLLTRVSAKLIAEDRTGCVSGDTAKSIARLRATGMRAFPDVADYCVTVLIRSARDGKRSFLRDTKASGATGASALDNGFMVAYEKNEPMSAGLPTMATLRPVAARCLSMNEPNIKLCYAAGYAFGQRARQGEVVTVP